VERPGVLVGRRRAVPLVGDVLGDDDGEADEDEAGDEAIEGPPQNLALDDDAAEIDLPVLLPGLRRSQQPALLRLVQLVVEPPHRQRAAVQVHVLAMVVLRRPVDGGDLEGPAPVVPRVHGGGCRPGGVSLALIDQRRVTGPEGCLFAEGRLGAVLTGLLFTPNTLTQRQPR
jgi:hypothetical protein